MYTEYEQELENDLPKIIHCLTTDAKTEEQTNELSSALYGWECKYGSDLLSEVDDLISDMARHLIENCGFETFEGV